MVVRRTALMCLMVMLGAWAATLTAEAPNTVQNATFDVSVVRVSKPDAQSSDLNLGKDRLEATNLTLQSLLQFAYKLTKAPVDVVIVDRVQMPDEN